MEVPHLMGKSRSSGSVSMKPERVELCIALRVSGEQGEFLSTATGVLQAWSAKQEAAESGKQPTAGNLEVRLLQAVVSTEPNVWEIRLSADSFAALGAQIDDIDRNNQESALMKILTHPAVSILDRGDFPLFRCWEFDQTSQSSQTPVT